MSPRRYMRMSLIVAAATALLTQAAFGQAQGGGTPPPTGTGGTGPAAGGTGTGTGTGGRGTVPSVISPPTTTQPNTQTPQAMPQPIFISGRVMLEDGTPPPDSVVMERVCNGQAHSEGYTDSKGYFGF